jgi:hypothetical protein
VDKKRFWTLSAYTEFTVVVDQRQFFGRTFEQVVHYCCSLSKATFAVASRCFVIKEAWLQTRPRSFRVNSVYKEEIIHFFIKIKTLKIIMNKFMNLFNLVFVFLIFTDAFPHEGLSSHGGRLWDEIKGRAIKGGELKAAFDANEPVPLGLTLEIPTHYRSNLRRM